MGLETLFIASSIASLGGTVLAAGAQSTAAKTQEAAARQNEIAAIQTSEAEAKRQARNDMRSLASAQAVMGASGVLAGSGSSLAVLTDMAAQMAENRLQIRYGGQVQAANARNRATAYGQQATGALVGGAAKFAGGAASSAYTYDSTWGGGKARLIG